MDNRNQGVSGGTSLKPDLTRRMALARLGLVAGTAYVAPMITPLNSAAADDRDGEHGPPWGRPSRKRSSKGHDR